MDHTEIILNCFFFYFFILLNEFKGIEVKKSRSLTWRLSNRKIYKNNFLIFFESNWRKMKTINHVSLSSLPTPRGLFFWKHILMFTCVKAKEEKYVCLKAELLLVTSHLICYRNEQKKRTKKIRLKSNFYFSKKNSFMMKI